MAGQRTASLTLDRERIRHLTGPGAQDSRIMIVGLGSGGFPVVQHLGMSGWTRFILIDPDALAPENLVKHPARRRDQRQLKVDVAAKWLLDRNPQCVVSKYPEDVTAIAPDELAELVRGCDMVVSATDSNPVRHFINDICVASQTAMTVGLVHRGGIGGTVMAFRPGKSGCYACLESVAEGVDGLPTDEDYPQTEFEQQMIYGRGIRDYAAAGLSADIALVAAVHAQVTVVELLARELPETPTVPRLSASWVAIQIRSNDSWHWRFTEFELPRIDGCVSCGAPVIVAD